MEIKQKAYEQPPAGTHTAILYSIIDLGTQLLTFQGESKTVPRVRFTFELPDELNSEFKPFSISIEMTFSGNSKSTLVKFLKSWLGETPATGFKIESLLGKACNLTVVHNPGKEPGQFYANIQAITPLKKGEVVKAGFNPKTLFEMSPPSVFSIEKFEALPEFLRNKIRVTPEYIEGVNWANGVRPQAKPVKLDDNLNDSIDF